jgi:hypothetical protein
MLVHVMCNHYSVTTSFFVELSPREHDVLYKTKFLVQTRARLFSASRHLSLGAWVLGWLDH